MNALRKITLALLLCAPLLAGEDNLRGLLDFCANAAWRNPAIAAARIRAVIKHQNEIRREKDAPLLGDEIEESTFRNQHHFVVEMPADFPYNSDHPYSGDFHLHDGKMIRSVQNDSYGINYVYEFEGPNLVKTTPHAVWVVQQLPGPTVTLYRSMSPPEYELWKQKKYTELGADWGHTHGEKVVHFSTSREFTSAGGSKRVAVQVPKALLMKWAVEGQAATAAIREPEEIFEIVLPASKIGELRALP